MTREELITQLDAWKSTAQMIVSRHAAIYARDVSIQDVDAICRALGEISIDEATAALDRLQRDINPLARE